MKRITFNHKDKDWKFWTPLILGSLLLFNETLWIFLSGSGLFAGDPDPTNIDFHDVFGVFYMLAYFTTQTNLFLAIMFFVIALVPTNRAYSWYMGSVVLMIITFFAFWSLLFQPNNTILEWSDPYFVTSTLFTHGFNPLTGFIFLIIIKKHIIINRQKVGLCAMYMMVYYIFNAILYTVTTFINSDGDIQGISVYKFLEMNFLFTIDFGDNLALAIFANLLLFIVCPFFPLTFSIIIIKIFKIKTEPQSYYHWMDILKSKIKKDKKVVQNEENLS